MLVTQNDLGCDGGYNADFQFEGDFAPTTLSTQLCCEAASEIGLNKGHRRVKASKRIRKKSFLSAG